MLVCMNQTLGHSKIKSQIIQNYVLPVLKSIDRFKLNQRGSIIGARMIYCRTLYTITSISLNSIGLVIQFI